MHQPLRGFIRRQIRRLVHGDRQVVAAPPLVGEPRLVNRAVRLAGIVATGLLFGSCPRHSSVEHGSERKGPVAAANEAESGGPSRADAAGTSSAREDAPGGSPAAASPCPRRDGLSLESLPDLPPSRHAAVLDAVWRTVWARHYDPTFGCVDWPAKRLIYGDRLRQVDDVEAAYAHINAMLGELGVSHLVALPPYRASAARGVGDGRLPFRVRWIQGQAVVTQTDRFGPPSGVPAGAVLTQIGEVRVADIERRTVAAASSRAHVDTLIVNALDDVLRCVVGTTRRVDFLDPGAADRTESRRVSCQAPPGRRVDFGHLTGLAVDVQSRMLDHATAYLAFNVWMLPAVDELRRRVAEFVTREVGCLVLDLRGNPGGVGAMVIPVASLFVSRTTPLGQLDMRDFTQRLDARPTANERPFLGPVAVLVDSQTASTSEIFTAAMLAHGRIRVYGATSTAGMALPSLIERLPDGGLLQYAVGRYRGPDGSEPEGAGIAPNVTVPVARADYVAGRDPVLERALADRCSFGTLAGQP
ncbi:MAG: hypothetical protein B7733_25485 [Myxococcales bacterium FL481]|nr:MAG: hypothetical protein B7733_25485 [Myxococcales bacterium FL481]